VGDRASCVVGETASCDLRERERVVFCGRDSEL